NQWWFLRLKEAIVPAQPFSVLGKSRQFNRYTTKTAETVSPFDIGERGHLIYINEENVYQHKWNLNKDRESNGGSVI
ncbi:MAG: hypothetical protein ABJL67_20740, partial [Sulfitobacter sp.]